MSRHILFGAIIILLIISAGCSGTAAAKIASPRIAHDDGIHDVNHHESIMMIKKNLDEYLSDKEFPVGIAVIVDGSDTITVNGGDRFEMMSVFKFPLTLAVAEWMNINDKTLSDSVDIRPDDLEENTWSPMLRKYGMRQLSLPISELLEWSLVESDNNAADILLRMIGGTSEAVDLMRQMQFPQDISIGASEAEMHADTSLSSRNYSTPLAMAILFDRFYGSMKDLTPALKEIRLLLEKCQTGMDRLPGPLLAVKAEIGHKTGTGFELPDGGVSALNDCGYVRLPGSHSYSIAVFIADSPYDINRTSAIIAEISSIVLRSLSAPRH